MISEAGRIVSIQCRGPKECYFCDPQQATVAITDDPNRNRVTCAQIFSSKDGILYCFGGSVVLEAKIHDGSTVRTVDDRYSSDMCEQAGCVRCVHAYPR